jgi:GNAT superfamily N-acetyltransferase
MTLAIRRGTLTDVDDAHCLICEVAEWLIARGEMLWGEPETSRDAVRAFAEAGELILGYLDGIPAACMFLHYSDPDFWPEDGPGEALYVHRLAVARRFAKQGFSQAMLGWAEAEARRLGRSYVRLDCEQRPKLIALYRDAGYVRVDEGPVQVHGYWVLRQQKRV